MYVVKIVSHSNPQGSRLRLPLSTIYSLYTVHQPAPLTAIPTCRCFNVAIVAGVFLDHKTWKRDSFPDLDWVVRLPQVDQVVRGPAVCSGTSEVEERLGILTAGYLQDTHLLVQGVEPQVHGTGQGQGDPAVLHSPLHSGLTGGQI